METALTDLSKHGAERAKLDSVTDLAALFDQYGARITTYLTRLVGDRFLAEDLCQDTFLKAFRAMYDGRVIDYPTAWLYTIATNTALSALRRRRILSFLSLQPYHASVDSVGDPESYAEREPVLRTLGALPAEQRTILLLCLHEGLSYQEAGEVLGVSSEVVKGRVYRARQAFIRSYRKTTGGRDR